MERMERMRAIREGDKHTKGTVTETAREGWRNERESERERRRILMFDERGAIMYK